MNAPTPSAGTSSAGTSSSGTSPAGVPLISVVVCSHNGQVRLPAALAALAAQDLDGPYEVIVVDDGSVDATSSVAHAAGIARVVTLEHNQGLSAARNAGVAVCRAPLVAFTDDDCVPPPNWLSSLLTLWKDCPPSVTAVGGHTVARDTDSLARRYVRVNNPLTPLELGTGGGIVMRLRAYLSPPPPACHRRHVYSLVGANMSFRRSALDEIGGFDPLIRFGGDEEDLCVRLRARFGDRTLLAEPSVVVAHDFERGLRDTLRRARAYGRGNGRDFARHGGFPALRPLPLFAAALAPVLLWSPTAGAAALLLLPAAVYRRFVPFAVRARSPEALLYPYLAAAQEFAADRGFLEEFLRIRRLSRRGN